MIKIATTIQVYPDFIEVVITSRFDFFGLAPVL